MVLHLVVTLYRVFFKQIDPHRIRRFGVHQTAETVVGDVHQLRFLKLKIFQDFLRLNFLYFALRFMSQQIWFQTKLILTIIAQICPVLFYHTTTRLFGPQRLQFLKILNLFQENFYDRDNLEKRSFLRVALKMYIFQGILQTFTRANPLLLVNYRILEHTG